MFSQLLSKGQKGPQLYLLLVLVSGVVLYNKSTLPTWLLPTFILAFPIFLHLRSDSQTSNIKKSINSCIPNAKWLPIRIPIINGLITAIKLRTIGVELAGYLSSYYGPTFKVDLGLSSVLVITKPDHIQAVLSSTSEHHLNKPEYFYGALLTNALKDGLFAVPYDTWMQHRRAVASAFTYKSFIPYLKFINDGAQKLVDQVVTHADETGVISNDDMKREMDMMAVTLISQIILGSENFNLTEAERDEFHKAFNETKDASMERFTNPEQMLPFVWALHPNKWRMNDSISRIFRHVYKLIFNYVAKDIIKGNEKIDVSNFSLESHTDSEYFHEIKKSGDTNTVVENITGVKPYECLLEQLIKASVSNKGIADEVTTFMVAGHETITTAMDMLLYHLAYNRDAQAKCQEEVDGFLLEHYPNEQNTACFTLEDLSQLKYLERCILESMRLTATVPMILRWLEKPLRVDKDTYFEGGQTMCMYIWGVHRDPKIYPDPEKFDPDRFLPEAVKARHSHAYLPFSLGARNCIGWKLALIEMKLILAKILRSYEFWTTDEPNDVKLHFHVTLKPERAYRIYYKQRRCMTESQ